MHAATALSLSFSLARFQPYHRPLLTTSAPLPPSSMVEALCSARPTLALFSYGFSLSPALADPLSLLSASHLFLICRCHPRYGCPLLPTGPHENTYFTGIHDGRRASVQTCLPGLPQTGRARPLSGRQRAAPGQPDSQSPFSLSPAFSSFFLSFFLFPLLFAFLNFHSPFIRISVARRTVSL